LYTVVDYTLLNSVGGILFSVVDDSLLNCCRWHFTCGRMWKIFWGHKAADASCSC